MDTREVVQQYFEYVNSGQWDKWLELFHEDAVMDDALSPRMEGIAALRQSTEQMQLGFEHFSNNLEELVVEGDRAMVICRIVAKTRMGTDLESQGANFYRVRDGKIAYMASFHDSAPFVKAFGGG